MIQAVRKMLTADDPTFTFTSLQLVVNGRAQLHTDRGNVGLSKTISFGPFCGGELCIHSAGDGQYKVVRAGVVETFDGHHGHLVLPFAGERLSFVAFTHAVIYTAASRGLLDSLVKLGFPLPEDAGKVRTSPVSRTMHLDEEAAA